MKSKPFLDKKFTLQRMKGKGGWTYIEISGISPEHRSYMGMIKVNGFIDDYKLDDFNLMPMKNGNMFMPVRAEIRKKISKQEGDVVRLILHMDVIASIDSKELIECMTDYPEAFEFYKKLPVSERKLYQSWINEAKDNDIRAKRIIKMIDSLNLKQKFSEM